MSNRDEMILDNMPLVGFVVNRLSANRYHTLGLDREDAMSYGVEGLIQSVDSYDPARSTSFASFAVQRIRGSILDAVRRQDPLPRSLRRSTREVERAAQELANQLGRWPTGKELAMLLGISAQEVHDIQKHTSSRFVSLEQVAQERAGEGRRSVRWEPVDDDAQGDPAQAAEDHASRRLLQQAMNQLSARDRKLLQLRYFDARTFREIGRLLGLSESRACQIHKRILGQLRQHLSRSLEAAA